MKKIVLLGATGAIGETVASELRKRGESYRAVGRDRASLGRAYDADPLAEIVVWNPDDAASARTAVRGADAIVYLVGVPYNHFELHPVVMRQTLDAAFAENVEQMLLVGTPARCHQCPCASGCRSRSSTTCPASGTYTN